MKNIIVLVSAIYLGAVPSLGNAGYSDQSGARDQLQQSMDYQSSYQAPTPSYSIPNNIQGYGSGGYQSNWDSNNSSNSSSAYSGVPTANPYGGRR